jgi:hypothetical protein
MHNKGSSHKSFRNRTKNIRKLCVLEHNLLYIVHIEHVVTRTAEQETNTCTLFIKYS